MRTPAGRTPHVMLPWAAAQVLARLAREVPPSVDPVIAELARHLDQWQRGPNVRVSVTGELLNRLLSQPLVASEPVRQQIDVGSVVGERRTTTGLSLRLMPSDDQWRMRLLAEGTISANLTVFSGEATFFIAGNGSYKSSKLLMLDRRQIDLAAAEATGDFDLQLRGYQTSMDVLPLLGQVARSTAMSRWQQRRFAARQKLQTQVQDQARQTLDRRTAAVVNDAKIQLESRALDPLRSLGLPLTPISLRTTPERIIGHYGLGELPLAATVPPAPPEGSLARVQLHQSAINNILQRLELGGREYQLKDLCRLLCTALSLPHTDRLDRIPPSLALRFADKQPLRVDFREGQAHLMARLASFRIAENEWQDLTIRCAYQFDESSHLPVLQRVGQVKVESRQLGLMDQMILDTAFAHLFAGASACRFCRQSWPLTRACRKSPPRSATWAMAGSLWPSATRWRSTPASPKRLRSFRISKRRRTGFQPVELAVTQRQSQRHLSRQVRRFSVSRESCSSEARAEASRDLTRYCRTAALLTALSSPRVRRSAVSFRDLRRHRFARCHKRTQPLRPSRSGYGRNPRGPRSRYPSPAHPAQG